MLLVLPKIMEYWLRFYPLWCYASDAEYLGIPKSGHTSRFDTKLLHICETLLVTVTTSLHLTSSLPNKVTVFLSVKHVALIIISSHTIPGQLISFKLLKLHYFSHKADLSLTGGGCGALRNKLTLTRAVKTIQWHCSIRPFIVKKHRKPRLYTCSHLCQSLPASHQPRNLLASNWLAAG